MAGILLPCITPTWHLRCSSGKWFHLPFWCQPVYRVARWASRTVWLTCPSRFWFGRPFHAPVTVLRMGATRANKFQPSSWWHSSRGDMWNKKHEYKQDHFRRLSAMMRMNEASGWGSDRVVRKVFSEEAWHLSGDLSNRKAHHWESPGGSVLQGKQAIRECSEW